MVRPTPGRPLPPPPPRPPRTPFVADDATIKLAEVLAKNDNSLVKVVPGTMYRVGHIEAWNMGDEWGGPELVTHDVRSSLWTKAHVITFSIRAATGETHVEFRLMLEAGLTPEEVAQMAEVYMMALNMRRKQ